MRTQPETQPEEPQPEKYARFIRLLTAIAAVPKTAIYDLDPALRRPTEPPKSEPAEN